MPGAVGEFNEIIIRGQKELEAAFFDLRKEVLRGLKPAVFAAGEPIRSRAVALNREHPSRLKNHSVRGQDWSNVRLGASVTRSAALLYLAPKARRRTRNPDRLRPELAPKLAANMAKARDEGEAKFLAALDVLVDTSAAKAGLL